jgi:glycosyltransferase involved in cell wall biosynthesis
MYGKRNPENFLRAVRQGVEEGVLDPSRMLLQFVGRFGGEVRAMFEDPVLRDAIRICEYVPHSESIEKLFASDALLMIVDDFAGNEEIVPGKVFEYIGAGKPIVTIAPEGAVAELIRETGSGAVARSDDIVGIKKIVLDFYRGWVEGEALPAGNPELIGRYERRAVTKRLAELLDGVAASRRG